MKLYIIKYLFHIIFDGEMTSMEIAEESGNSIYSVSHAMGLLHSLKLIKHPEKRPRSWEADHTSGLIKLIEKLLLVSKNDPEIKVLLELPSVIRIGAVLQNTANGFIISNIIESTHISMSTLLKVLNKMVALNLLIKKPGKPHFYYIPNTILSQLFFNICNEIAKIIGKRNEKKVSSQEIIRLLKNDKSVLILVQYGSSARGAGDNLSDIDILAVTHDKISRGNILDRYAHKKIDLHVYSKSGFLQLIKTQPDFIKNISTAKVLKGEEILRVIV